MFDKTKISGGAEISLDYGCGGSPRIFAKIKKILNRPAISGTI